MWLRANGLRIKHKRKLVLLKSSPSFVDLFCKIVPAHKPRGRAEVSGFIMCAFNSAAVSFTIGRVWKGGGKLQ